MRRPLLIVAALALLVAALGFVRARSALSHQRPRSGDISLRGIHKIKHVVMIMQENRSFDSYFGTYPGADGIPMDEGQPTVCVHDPKTGVCVRPFHDSQDRNVGGPHDHLDAVHDIDHRHMDGFVRQERLVLHRACRFDTRAPLCDIPASRMDVMGYHDDREIPNYWAYARSFVLQDHMFQPDTSWSLPVHLFMVSEWSARCRKRHDPMSCVNAVQDVDPPPGTPPEQDRKGARLRVGRSDVPPSQASRLLAVLRLQGLGAGL